MGRVSTRLSTAVQPAQPARGQPLTPASCSSVHSLGITLWTSVGRSQQTACGAEEDNMWITGHFLWVNARSHGLSCERAEPVHRTAPFSTVAVHGSSTELQPPHLQRRRLSTESTGPMTMMRPIGDGSSPEYLGTNPSRSSHHPWPPGLTRQNHRELLTRCWPSVPVALGSIRTSVNCTANCTAVSRSHCLCRCQHTHVCRRAGYR